MKKLATLTAAAALAAFGLAGPAQATDDFCAGSPYDEDTYITGGYTHSGDCDVTVTAAHLVLDYATIDVDGDLTITGSDADDGTKGTVETKYTHLHVSGNLVVTTANGDQKINNSPYDTIAVGANATFWSTGKGSLDINNNVFAVGGILTVQSHDGDVDFNNNSGTSGSFVWSATGVGYAGENNNDAVLVD